MLDTCRPEPIMLNILAMPHCSRNVPIMLKDLPIMLNIVLVKVRNVIAMETRQ